MEGQYSHGRVVSAWKSSIDMGRQYRHGGGGGSIVMGGQYRHSRAVAAWEGGIGIDGMGGEYVHGRAVSAWEGGIGMGGQYRHRRAVSTWEGSIGIGGQYRHGRTVSAWEGSISTGGQYLHGRALPAREGSIGTAGLQHRQGIEEASNEHVLEKCWRCRQARGSLNHRDHSRHSSSRRVRQSVALMKTWRGRHTGSTSGSARVQRLRRSPRADPDVGLCARRSVQAWTDCGPARRTDSKVTPHPPAQEWCMAYKRYENTTSILHNPTKIPSKPRLLNWSKPYYLMNLSTCIFMLLFSIVGTPYCSVCEQLHSLPPCRNTKF